jgi:hypothetical protein
LAPTRRTATPAAIDVDVADTSGTADAAVPHVLFGTDDLVLDERRVHAEHYEIALALYQGARFAEARHHLEALLDQTPDEAAAFLLKRTHRYLAPDGTRTGLSDEELAAWTGVEVMTDK